MINTDKEAPDDVLGAFADLAEIAFNEGLSQRELAMDGGSPYLLLTMLMESVGTLAQYFLRLSWLMASDHDEEMLKSVQSDAFDAAVKVLTFAILLTFKLRGTK